MHADLQRKLIRFLKRRHPQVIVATHSIEIMAEVEPESILVVDREKRQAQFTTDIPEVQRVVDQIGGIQNLQLARLWGSHRCLFVEGKDISLLKHFQNKVFPDSDPIDAIPSMPVGGWSGWSYAIGSSMLLSSAIGQSIRSYCVFDSDFHTPGQIANRKAEALKKGLDLHIWEREELENYLLTPTVIRRVIVKRLRGEEKAPTIEELTRSSLSLPVSLNTMLWTRSRWSFCTSTVRAALPPQIAWQEKECLRTGPHRRVGFHSFPASWF